MGILCRRRSSISILLSLCCFSNLVNIESTLFLLTQQLLLLMEVELLEELLILRIKCHLLLSIVALIYATSLFRIGIEESQSMIMELIGCSIGIIERILLLRL